MPGKSSAPEQHLAEMFEMRGIPRVSVRWMAALGCAPVYYVGSGRACGARRGGREEVFTVQSPTDLRELRAPHVSALTCHEFTCMRCMVHVRTMR